MQSSELAARLQEAGVVDDLGTLQRLVVDMVAGAPVKVYVQRFGDEKLLDVDWGGVVYKPPEEVPDPFVKLEDV